MIPVKTPEEIVAMRRACQVAATILDRLCSLAQPGMATQQIDRLGQELIDSMGVVSACYNYRMGSRRYPGYICISVNEEVVHGIGSAQRILREGDAVKIDVSVICDGFVGDNARTIVLSPASEAVVKMADVAREALHQGIRCAVEGNRVGDISHAIQSFVESAGYSVVREFVGHGVGRSMHEEPQIPNFGRPGSGAKLKAGMTLAIEPMVNMGAAEVEYASDGWTALTCDRKPSAHFEHTVLVTTREPEILTLSKK